MRRAAAIVAAMALSLTIAACSDDDDVSRADPPTTPTTALPVGTTDSDESEDEDEETEAEDTPEADELPAVRMMVELPAALSEEFSARPARDHAWVIELFGTETASAFGYLGVGNSAEPADVLDPDTPPLGNQALAAANGVAADLVAGLGTADVAVNEGAALATGRPAWHVLVRFTTAAGPVEIDLVGLDDAGAFHYAFAVSHDLPDSTVSLLRDAVAAATFG